MCHGQWAQDLLLRFVAEDLLLLSARGHGASGAARV